MPRYSAVDPLLLALSVVHNAEILCSGPFIASIECGTQCRDTLQYKNELLYLIIVPEHQRKLIGMGRLKLLEDDLRRKGLEQSLINVQ